MLTGTSSATALVLAWLSTALAFRVGPEHHSGVKILTTGLPDCLKESTYKLRDNGITKGQCPPSQHPGAFYKNSEGDWQCWSDDTAEGIRNDNGAKDAGYDGACVFGDYLHKTEQGNSWWDQNRPSWLKPKSEVSPCKEVPQSCSDLSAFWGACYAEGSTNNPDGQRCISRDDKEDIRKALRGDCLSYGVPDEDKLYAGVCEFEQQEVTGYKCETVTATFGSAESCQSDMYSACFSLEKGVTWQCMQDQLTNKHCAGTRDPTGSHYDGTCYFEKASEYKGAQDGKSLKQRAAATAKPTEPVTTSTTTEKPETTKAQKLPAATTAVPKGVALRWHPGGLAAAVSLAGLAATA